MRIETYGFFGVCVAIATSAASMGCSDNGAGGGSAGTAGSAGAASTTTGATGATGTTGTGSTGAGGSGSGTAGPNDHLCVHAPSPPAPVTSALISDFDNEAGLGVQSVAGLHGVWMMDVDQAPPMKANAAFALAACGTNGNGLHFTVTGNAGWGCDVAAAFISASAPVDASKYRGISFVLKSATAVPVTVKLTNVDSQPSVADNGMGCGLCDPNPMDATACYSGFAKTVSSDPAGTPITVEWSGFPVQNWGVHFPNVFQVDPSSLEGISFSVDSATASFDLCIDDVKFF